MIVQITGKKILTQGLVYALVQGDLIDEIEFIVPQYYQDVDLSGFDWKCKYVVPSGAGDLSDLVTTVVNEEIHAVWTMPANATSESGALKFQLLATDATRIWQTTFAAVPMNAQLSPSGEEFTVLFLENYLSQFNAIKDETQAIADDLLAQKGAPNGIAELGADGKIPADQLPSYVDDIIEVVNYAALPVTGETGKIYVTLDTGRMYRWSGTVYVEVSNKDAEWGNVSGTLSDQTDLQDALDALSGGIESLSNALQVTDDGITYNSSISVESCHLKITFTEVI